MINLSRAFLTLAAVCLISAGVFAQKSNKIEISVPKDYRPASFETSTELQSLLETSIGEVLNSYPPRGFKADDISATIIDLRDPANLRWANFMGEDRVYPASVVKMYYMAALHRQLQDGKIKLTPELERGLKDMIVDSSNEATQYILDVLTDTSSGGEMPEKEFVKWGYQRNRVNRYFHAMGYENINVNQKTFCEDAYGREQQFRNYKGENRNMLTANATARLMAEIVLGRIATPERTKMMMELMKRDPFVESKDPDSQATGFSGKALIDMKLNDAKIWSKAGWTSKTRHDVAYIETADGLKFVIAIFTENHATERDPIPTLVGKIIRGLKNVK